MKTTVAFFQHRSHLRLHTLAVRSTGSIAMLLLQLQCLAQGCPDGFHQSNGLSQARLRGQIALAPRSRFTAPESLHLATGRSLTGWCLLASFLLVRADFKRGLKKESRRHLA